MGVYATAQDIADEVGVPSFLDSPNATIPSLTQVNNKINEVETEIQKRGYTSTTASNIYVDIHSETDTVLATDLPYYPIVSISSLKVRQGGLNSPSYTTMTEWDGTTQNTDFIILKGNNGFGGLVGYAIKFLKKSILKGEARLRITYNYGWNLPTEILKEYVKLRVARWALEIIIANADPNTTGSQLVMGDVVIPAKPIERITWINQRLDELEGKLPSTLNIARLTF